MEWTRSETLGIANHACTQCHGLGLRGGRLSERQPCNCVLRAIFRICYEKFHQVSTQERRMSRVTLDGTGPQCRRVVWGRKDEEYIADFLAVAKRTLREDEHRIFRMHFLLGGTWRICCDKLGIDKGTFFHAVYRIEERMGRVLREMKPYALYPLDEYFSGVRMDHNAAPKTGLSTTASLSEVVAMPAAGRAAAVAGRPLEPPLKGQRRLSVLTHLHKSNRRAA
ncbi:MAG: hypothetical protein JST65_03030 [Acidobacteria bacterium]|nr:hypothetical protein [Acidobacteriota bacterium]